MAIASPLCCVDCDAQAPRPIPIATPKAAPNHPAGKRCVFMRRTLASRRARGIVLSSEGARDTPC